MNDEDDPHFGSGESLERFIRPPAIGGAVGLTLGRWELISACRPFWTGYVDTKVESQAVCAVGVWLQSCAWPLEDMREDGECTTTGTVQARAYVSLCLAKHEMYQRI